MLIWQRENVGLDVGLVLNWMLMIFGNLGWGWIEDKCKKFFGWEEFYQTVGCWSAQIEKYL